MDTTQIKNTHGGKRNGAGRKKSVTGRYFGFNSTAEVQAILENLNGSKSEFINRAILEFAKKKVRYNYPT